VNIIGAITHGSLYKWHVRDETAGHCGRCMGRNGQTKSGDEWDLLGRPPLHRHCGCTLELVWQDPDDIPDGPPDEHHVHNSEDQPDDPVNDPTGDNKPKNPPATPPTVPSGQNKPKPPPSRPNPPSGGGNKRR